MPYRYVLRVLSAVNGAARMMAMSEVAPAGNGPANSLTLGVVLMLGGHS